MRKQVLIVEQTQFDPALGHEVAVQQAQDDIANERVFINADGHVERRPEPPRHERRPARPARPPRRDGLEAMDPDRFKRFTEVDFVVCYSMADAEEYVGEVLARNPQYKFVIYESTAFLEVVATPTVKKKWDQNGQFVDV